MQGQGRSSVDSCHRTTVPVVERARQHSLRAQRRARTSEERHVP